jgi:hypothetical protein
MKKLEQKTIERIIDVNNAYRRHKAFMRKFGREPMPREVFIQDYMAKQQERIRKIKAIIVRFNDPNAPIFNSVCLEWRRLFSIRQSYIDPTHFGETLNEDEFQTFYNHLNQCKSCSYWSYLHKNDAPVIIESKEEVSQAEFEKSLNDLWGVLRPQGDPFEDAERRRGLKPVNMEDVEKALSEEYGW